MRDKPDSASKTYVPWVLRHTFLRAQEEGLPWLQVTNFLMYRTLRFMEQTRSTSSLAASSVLKPDDISVPGRTEMLRVYRWSDNPGMFEEERDSVGGMPIISSNFSVVFGANIQKPDGGTTPSLGHVANPETPGQRPLLGNDVYCLEAFINHALKAGYVEEQVVAVPGVDHNVSIYPWTTKTAEFC